MIKQIKIDKLGEGISLERGNYMKKFDKIIIVCVLLISLFGFLYLRYIKEYNFNDKKAIISIDGEIYKTVELTKDTEETIELDTEFGKNTIKLYKQGADIIDADCPDKVCVEDGFIDKPGEILVCLPNKVVIEIIGEKEDELDDTSY